MAPIIESLTKSADKTSITVGEEVTFSFVFSSTQSATVQVTFVDNLPPCLQFVPRSLFLDGVNIPDANPVTGFIFTHTRDFPSHEITFTARAICVPDNGFVANSATAVYVFAGVPDVITSNTIQIQITQVGTCDAVGEQLVNICVPVSVQPFATVGPISVRCCGAPTVEPGTVCPGIPNLSCDFTISQTICVEVPVEFGAVVNTGETNVLCAGQSCANCPA